MPKEFVTVEGLSELDAALKELPKATGKNVIRRSLIAAAQPILDEATQLIVVRRVTPQIAMSKVKFSGGDAGKRAFAEAMARGASREEAGEAAHEANASDTGEGSGITAGVLSVGPTRRAFYGFEFGTIRQAPQPFMRPAWDGNKTGALDIITEQLAAEIKKAAARIAAKQKRLLSKI
jgi:HK97 gp10 family phage protein